MKKIHPAKVTRKSFHNQRSHEAALYAVEIINHMIHRASQGDIIFEYENLVKPNFEAEFFGNGTFAGLFLRDGENCRVQIIGDETDPDSGLIYCTKRNIREYFKLWRVAKIVNVNKVTDLTK
jgi:hypothetical protein